MFAGSCRKARPNLSEGKGNDNEVNIGPDVSLASTAICVLDAKGNIVTEVQVASAPDSLVSFLRELPHGIAAIGLEAGPLSQWLHKVLTDAGLLTSVLTGYAVMSPAGYDASGTSSPASQAS